MGASKALILKGILGITGLCASGAGGIGLGLGKAFGEVQKDQDSADDSSPEPVALEDTGEVVEEEDGDLGIPEECVATCVLTAEQLRNLKFEVKEGSSIEFEGLEDSDKFELTIEESEDQINYPKGKKYTLKPKTTTGTVTIKNIKEVDIVLGKDKEVLIREVIGGGKLEHLLEEVDGLGIPKRCVGDQSTQPCEITDQLQLEKFKFEAREGEKIRVEGLNEDNKVILTIEDKGDDEDNYPKGKKYKLTSTGYVLMEGVKGGNILLEKDKEFVIREKKGGGGLEEVLDEVDRLGIPKRCNADQVSSGTKTCSLIQKQLKDLKFEAKEGTSITVEGWNDNSKFDLEIEDKSGDTENYPQGKKYTLKPKTGTATIRGIKDGDITIWDEQSAVSRETREEGGKFWEGQWVVIRETSGGGRLERAPEEVDYLGIPKRCTPGKTCQLTEYQVKNLQFVVGNEGITVEGIKKAKTVGLMVEDKENNKENYPKGKKYTLSARRSAVAIKGLKDGDIEIEKEGAVVIREKENERKLERAPEEVNNLGIPRRCESRCQLTKEQFERLKFEAKSGSPIIFGGLNENSSFELKVETTYGDPENYPKWKKYTLKSTNGRVTIGGAKGKDIVLEENKAVVFREIKEGNKLETSLDILGIPRGCGAEEIKRGSEPKTCYLSSEQLKDLIFENFEGVTEEVKVEGLTGKIALTISWDEDQNTYPDNRKYSFDNSGKDKKDIKITKGDLEVIIAKQKKSWFKNNEGKLAIAEIKTKSQIEMENKLSEIKEILRQVGLEGLQIGDFAVGSSAKRQQTYIEFKKVEELKKIQFKEFMGGADSTTSFRSKREKIMVYLDWDNKFPKNMKFSFENQYFTAPGFNFWNGNKKITIYEKDSKTYNARNTFKVEKVKDRWYLVRS